MKNISIWKDLKQKKVCPELKKDIETDVLIIGGGITGLSTAYHLLNKNLNVCLVEKNEIASGVSSKTTGKITFLQENIYSKLSTYHSKEKSKLYLESQIEAINLVKNIIIKNNINCDLEKVDSYVFSNNDEEKLDEELILLKDFGIKIKESKTLPNNNNVNQAIYTNDTYVFHPLKYLYELKNICLKNNIQIYENTNILSIDKEKDYYICKTQNNIIKTECVVLALHYPYFLKPFFLPLKTYIEKSYIEAYKTDNNLNYSAININNPTISTRYHTNNKNTYKLYLTNSHNTCINDNDKDNFTSLLNSNCKNPEYLWSNKDIMTNDLLPFIGALDDDKKLLIGTGYNTWGMTNGSLAGKIISDIILRKRNIYINLFNPKRKINSLKILNFPLIIGSNALSFIKSKVYKNKPWYPNNVKFEKRNGKNIAIYIDENKKEHIVYNKCPHLKCGLLFNEIEKTWDCPCHGSRFDIDGNTIEGPSNYNIKY